MKTDVFDVLMYVFETYSERPSLLPPQWSDLESELSKAGFAEPDILKAVRWLSYLEQEPTQFYSIPSSIRIYSKEEQQVLGVPCMAFLMNMEATDLLKPEQRERLLDRIIALEIEKIDVEQLQWLSLMVLTRDDGNDDVCDWIEALLYDEPPEMAN